MNITEILSQPWVIASIFMAGDIITGFLQAVKNKTVSSKKMREGLWHKGGFTLAIVLAYGIDIAVDTMSKNGFDMTAGLDLQGFAPVIFCGYIIITEIASIIENLCKINPIVKDSVIGNILNKKGTEKDGEGK